MLSSASVPTWSPEASRASILHKGDGVSQGMQLLCILTFGTENLDKLKRSFIKWMVKQVVTYLETKMVKLYIFVH